jgi:ubiquinol-cytochrome c reductase cytochrome c1 subunit
MLKYDDGTPASTPQMAHDVSVFLNFMESYYWPDFKLTMKMMWTALLIWAPICFIYVHYHMFNCHSYRYEVYALRDATAYNKFREKAWRHHRNRAIYHGEFS